MYYNLSSSSTTGLRVETVLRLHRFPSAVPYTHTKNTHYITWVIRRRVTTCLQIGTAAVVGKRHPSKTDDNNIIIVLDNRIIIL